jgi:hypothetical protein
MGFTTAAYAQIDFKAWGSLTFGGLYERNFANMSGAVTSVFGAPFVPSDVRVDPGITGAWNKPTSWLSEYANIFFEWDAGKEIKGIFNIETCDYYTGTNTSPNAAANWVGAAFNTGLWDTRVPETRLRQAYVQFAIPYIGIPVPMTMSLGIIPMGVRPAFLFLLTEGGGIQLDMKADPASISFAWGKMAEGKLAIADDSDHYSLEARVNAGPATIGGYLVYQNMNTYPIAYNAAAYGVPSSTYDARFWWLGVYADAKAGPVDLNFDFGYDTGKVRRQHDTLAVVPNAKYNGWKGQLRITYPISKYAVGLFGSYASGADLRKTDTNGLPGNGVADPVSSAAGVTTTKIGTWVYPVGSAQWVIWGESMFLGGHFSTIICIPQGWGPTGAAWNVQASRGGDGGTWVAKVFARASVTPSYNITAWALYIGDTTKHGNTFGNALTGDGSLRNDKGIGWELALVNDVSIYKNLMWSTGIGYLFAGKGLDQNIPGTLENARPRNPWIIGSKVAYNF